MQKPAPILVADRFPALLDALLDLLGGLNSAEWEHTTELEGWNVKDIVQHMLGVETNYLSGKRDHYSEPHEPLDDWDTLIAFINHRNAIWVEATRRLSPRVLCDLMRISGDQVNAYLQTQDMFQMGGPVDWAGSGPAPVWLDVAREFTERWHHQQHIRDAVGKPGAMQPYFLAPVLAAFVYALPQTYKGVEAPEGTVIRLNISGPAGGTWSVVREQYTWQLYDGAPERLDAGISLPEEIAWRLFTKGIDADQARLSAQFSGDQVLAERALKTISILA